MTFFAANVSRPGVRRWLPWCAGAVVALGVLLALAGVVVAHRVQPLLRARLVNMLGERFGSPVALDALTVFYDGGLQVDGRGLRVQSVLRGVPGDAAHPMLRVDAFHFRVGLWAAMSESPRIHHVRLRGVQLELPALAAQPGPPITAQHEVELDYAEIADVHIRFASAEADRAPLLFDLPKLQLRGVSRSRPILFQATVDNGAPIGLSETAGAIGPWNFDDPRLTPIAGSVHFEDRDVRSVRGLRGRLSLQGQYRGTVADMHVEGSTTDPAFGLDVSRQPVALRTKFAMTLHAATGEVALESLEGQFLKTTFRLRGTAVKNRAPEGWRFDYQLDAPGARLEDVLALVAHTPVPLLRGALAVQGRLAMRAGAESVSTRLALTHATLHATGTTFGNGSVQAEANALASRARGDVAQARDGSAAPVAGELSGPVVLQQAMLQFPALRLVMPGAVAEMHGNFALQSTVFHFQGTVRTEAKLSHLTGGVKGLLLRPFNGLFRHGGSGAVLPVVVDGLGDMPRVSTRVAGVKVNAPGTH